MMFILLSKFQASMVVEKSGHAWAHTHTPTLSHTHTHTDCILCLPNSLYLQAELYKEDFIKERTDRERAAGRLDSLQRTQVEEMKGLQKELSQVKEEAQANVSQVKQAKEEAQAKTSQVKQYKKQLDAQEAKACYVLIGM